MANDVATLPEFKDYLGTQLTANEDWLQDLLDAAVSGAGTYCQRRFVLASGTPSARVYVPEGDLVRPHDCVSITSITENGSTVASSEWQAEPLNGLTAAGVSVPYSRVRRLGGWWYAYGRQATISVEADWGWSDFPIDVKTAVLMLGKDLRSGRDTSFGIAAMTEYAAVRARQNLQVAALLRDFRRVESWGIA